MIQVIAFAGAFSDPCEYRDTAVLHGNIVNHFHHDNRFTDTGPTEEAHFSASWKRHQQIDNLDAGFKDPHCRILLGK